MNENEADEIEEGAQDATPLNSPRDDMELLTSEPGNCDGTQPEDENDETDSHQVCWLVPQWGINNLKKILDEGSRKILCNPDDGPVKPIPKRGEQVPRGVFETSPFLEEANGIQNLPQLKKRPVERMPDASVKAVSERRSMDAVDTEKNIVREKGYVRDWSQKPQQRSINKGNTDENSTDLDCTASLVTQVETEDASNRTVSVSIPRISNKSLWRAEFLRLNASASMQSSCEGANLSKPMTPFSLGNQACGTLSRIVEDGRLQRAVSAGQLNAGKTNENTVPQGVLKSKQDAKATTAEDEDIEENLSRMFLPADMFMGELQRRPSMVFFGVFGEALGDGISEIDEEEECSEEEYPEEYVLPKYTEEFTFRSGGTTCPSTESSSISKALPSDSFDLESAEKTKILEFKSL